MRHADIATTMKYYVQIGADDVAAELWAKFPAGDTPGDIYPKTAAGGDGATAGEMTESPGRKRA